MEVFLWIHLVCFLLNFCFASFEVGRGKTDGDFILATALLSLLFAPLLTLYLIFGSIGEWSK